MAIAFAMVAGLGVPAHGLAAQVKPSLQNVTQAVEGTTLVVGSIRYRKNKQDSECGELLQQCEIIVVPPEGSNPLVYPFKRGGPFTWALPAGDYIIAGLNRGRNGKSISDVIHVPDGGGAIYVGDLTFDVSDEGIRVWLDDNYGAAATRFDAGFPDRAGTLTRNLIGTYGNPGEWSDVVPICSGGWGVSRNIARQGLVPVLPTKTRGPAFTIKESQPRFAWTPSAQQRVTYDLALFDAVLAHGVPYRGRMIAYRQAIEQPSWQPDKALEAGRVYLWSVRIRRGNVISTWSTHTASYSTGFLGMNAAVAYGEWFRFDLPAARPSP